MRHPRKLPLRTRVVLSIAGVAIWFAIDVGGILFVLEQLHGQTWPQTVCIIASSEALAQNTLRMSYTPRVDYWYTLGGIRYHGSRLSFGDDASDERSVRERLAPYPAGASVPCYVDPHDEERVVLDRHVRIPIGTVIEILAGNLIVWFWIEGTIRAVRLRRSSGRVVRSVP